MIKYSFKTYNIQIIDYVLERFLWNTDRQSTDCIVDRYKQVTPFRTNPISYSPSAADNWSEIFIWNLWKPWLFFNKLQPSLPGCGWSTDIANVCIWLCLWGVHANNSLIRWGGWVPELRVLRVILLLRYPVASPNWNIEICYNFYVIMRYRHQIRYLNPVRDVNCEGNLRILFLRAPNVCKLVNLHISSGIQSAPIQLHHRASRLTSSPISGGSFFRGLWLTFKYNRFFRSLISGGKHVNLL